MCINSAWVKSVAIRGIDIRDFLFPLFIQPFVAEQVQTAIEISETTQAKVAIKTGNNGKSRTSSANATLVCIAHVHMYGCACVSHLDWTNLFMEFSHIVFRAKNFQELRGFYEWKIVCMCVCVCVCVSFRSACFICCFPFFLFRLRIICLLLCFFFNLCFCCSCLPAVRLLSSMNFNDILESVYINSQEHVSW